jgi:hypothetical protein
VEASTHMDGNRVNQALAEVSDFSLSCMFGLKPLPVSKLQAPFLLGYAEFARAPGRSDLGSRNFGKSRNADWDSS